MRFVSSDRVKSVVYESFLARIRDLKNPGEKGETLGVYYMRSTNQ